MNLKLQIDQLLLLCNQDVERINIPNTCLMNITSPNVYDNFKRLEKRNTPGMGSCVLRDRVVA